jgi:hypothetical protein
MHGFGKRFVGVTENKWAPAYGVIDVFVAIQIIYARSFAMTEIGGYIIPFAKVAR